MINIDWKHNCAYQRGSILPSHPEAWAQFSAFSKIYYDVAEIYRWHGAWLEESRQRLKNVDLTYPVLASGKLVLQKNVTGKN